MQSSNIVKNKSYFEDIRASMKRVLSEHRLLILGLLAVLMWFVAFYGLKISYTAQGKATSFTGLFYLAAQMLILNVGLEPGPENVWLSLARFCTPILLLATAGEIFIRVFRDSLQLMNVRWRYQGHVVICGLDQKGLQFAREARDNGRQVVIIEPNQNQIGVEECKEQGAIVVIGNPKDRTQLERVNIARAGEVICALDDEGSNAEVCALVRDICAGDNRQDKLHCIVHVVSPQMCDLLRLREAEFEKDTGLDLEFLNVYQRCAKMMLTEYTPFGQVFDRMPHMLVIGLGQFGQSVVLEGVRIARINSDGQGKDLLHVTMVDRRANEIAKSLEAHYNLASLGCVVTPCEMDVESDCFRNAQFCYDSGLKPTSVYVCFHNESMGIKTALTLFSELKEPTIPIVMKTMHQGGIGSYLPRIGEKSDWESVHAFSLIESTCKADWAGHVTTEILAKAIHHHYLWSMFHKGTRPRPNMKPWDQLDKDVKKSNMDRAAKIEDQLRAIGCKKEALTQFTGNPDFEFTPEEVELMAKIEHKRWMDEKKAEGWAFGAPRDDKAKKHPDLVSWEESNAASKDYNRQSVKKLPVLLAAVDLQIVRSS
jgi:hypothetical protein